MPKKYGIASLRASDAVLATVLGGGTAAGGGGVGFCDGEVSGVPDLCETLAWAVVPVLMVSARASRIPNAKTSEIRVPITMCL